MASPIPAEAPVTRAIFVVMSVRVTPGPDNARALHGCHRHVDGPVRELERAHRAERRASADLLPTHPSLMSPPCGIDATASRRRFSLASAISDALAR